MDEFALIRRFFDRRSGDAAVILGVGDDGALTRVADNNELVTVIDTLVADVHFPSSLRAADIGYRVVAVNLSDIAAMGARPRWMTLALTLDVVDIPWLDGFSRGLFEAADAYAVSLIGGDTTSGMQIVATVQMSGEVEEGTALRRSGAGPGDDIFVSGSVGDAAMGLSLLRRGDVELPAERVLVERFARPTPRVALGRRLREVATAAIDVSDGLFGDTAKLLASSGAGGTIDMERLPVSEELWTVAGEEEGRLLALSGGDDYELCFTAPPGKRAEIEALSADLGHAVTRIGRVTEGSGLRCLQHGEPVEYADAGYRHF